MKIEIPPRWRQMVAAILEASLPGTIVVVRSASQNWRNLDEAHYDRSLYAVLAEALSVEGKLYGKLHSMNEEGECYSFTLPYHPPSVTGEIELYTKLILLPACQGVIVYSAHT